MATSRTGTAKYKRWRKNVLAKGQRDGVTHCPLCNKRLNYQVTRLPESAEPDHIRPHAMGGRESVDNGRVICRDCNGKRWMQDRAKRNEVQAPIQASPIW